MEMEGHDSEQDGSLSNNEEELSDMHDEDSDELLRARAIAMGNCDPDADILAKLKAQVREMDRVRESGPAFPMPLPFSFPHPTAFLTPVPPYPAQPPHNSSGSSHSDDSSTSSQQHTWSFEEQFKQVRQLYEISDEPKRKEFLDDLFSFMQKRGTPINRLPIMAKSVLDLYELYNLVIARGGLVDVINKKMWQEIIKGLHLPSSITSAAFTLRTQYMKYLYPYETAKLRLSSPNELQAAIDGNRREGRRTTYGSYPDIMRRSPVPNQTMQMNAMSPLSHIRPHINGNGHMPHPALHPALAQPPMPANPVASLGPEFVMDYMRMINKELRKSSSPSPPTSTSPRESLSALDMSRLQLWNLYNNNHHPVTPEPQKEALNLGVKDEPKPQIAVKREEEIMPQNGPPNKKVLLSPEPKEEEVVEEKKQTPNAHIKITSRTETRNPDGSLLVSMEINGTTYQGVLFAQGETA